MKFYAAFSKVEENSDGTLTIEGIASTESVDSDGEVVKAAAIEAALPDFMKHGTGAMREMHQPMAAGTVDSVNVADGTTTISGTVVDPVAISKVKKGVYKGFSIGGKVTDRDLLNKKHVTGVRLVEISLVDRPANPDAVISMWKAEGVSDAEAEALEKDEGAEQIEQVIPPNKGDDFEQVWRSNRDQTVHLKKGDLIAHHKTLDDAAALKELAGPALEKIGEIEKAMGNGEAVETAKPAPYVFADGKSLNIFNVDGVKVAAGEWASGPEKFRVKHYIAKRAKELDAVSVLPDGWIDAPVEATIEKAISLESLANMLQLLACIDRAEDRFEYEYIWDDEAVNASPELKARFGAMLVEFGGIIRESLDLVLSAMTAEEATEALTRGDLAVDIMKAGARNSKADAAKLQDAHDALVKLGADCAIGKGGHTDDLNKSEPVGDLAKALNELDLQKQAYGLLSAKIDELAPSITNLAKANADMAKEIEILKAQPMPAKTGGPMAVSKETDTIGVSAEPVITKAEVFAMLNELSPEDRALALIKVSRGNPMTFGG